jgi:hypothetical protein
MTVSEEVETQQDVSNFHCHACVTVYRPADVVRHEVCPGLVQSGGAAGRGATRRRGTRRAGRGVPAPGRASPRLRSEFRSYATRRRRTFGPSGRGGRAERAQARPYVARRGSAALSLAIPARARVRRSGAALPLNVFHFSFFILHSASVAGTEDCGGSTGSSPLRRPRPSRGGFGRPGTTC